METFDDVIRSLLDRINAIETAAARSPASVPRAGGRYRVAPTAWGVEKRSVRKRTATAPASPASPPSVRRRGLRIAVRRLPIPRGLLAV